MIVVIRSRKNNFATLASGNINIRLLTGFLSIFVWSYQHVSMDTWFAEQKIIWPWKEESL